MGGTFWILDGKFGFGVEIFDLGEQFWIWEEILGGAEGRGSDFCLLSNGTSQGMAQRVLKNKWRTCWEPAPPRAVIATCFTKAQSDSEVYGARSLRVPRRWLASFAREDGLEW